MPEPIARRRPASPLPVLLALAALVAPAAAYACRCVPLTAATAARAADAVAWATVEAVSDADPHARRYRLRVAESWKRRLPAVVTITSARTTCMAELAPGRRYLVYLDADRGGFSTEACSGNLPEARAAAALAALRRGHR